ncbi:hypothetical protein ACMXYW_13360 [Neptuniibacter sp. QD48_55]|uniref:hypothetical protein n=1 Tax=Neptuniibacter sp. QD48_55 TaxID=3398212 RepID=UPI0039F451CD
MNQRVEEPTSLSDKLKNHSHLLPYLPLLVAIIAPAGYLVGLGFQAGYLNSFGGLSSAFPLSVTDAYVYGYYTITFYLIKLLPFLTSSTLWVSIIGIVVFFVSVAYLGINTGNRKAVGLPDTKPVAMLKNAMSFFSPENNDLSKAITYVYEELSSIAKKAYWGIWVILIWIGITVYSFDKGKELADISKKQFLQDKCVFNSKTAISNCIKVYDDQNNLITEGLLIGFTNNRLGIFTEEGATISELPPNAKIVKTFDKKTFLAAKLETNAP